MKGIPGTKGRRLRGGSKGRGGGGGGTSRRPSEGVCVKEVEGIESTNWKKLGKLDDRVERDDLKSLEISAGRDW